MWERIATYIYSTRYIWRLFSLSCILSIHTLISAQETAILSHPDSTFLLSLEDIHLVVEDQKDILSIDNLMNQYDRFRPYEEIARYISPDKALWGHFRIFVSDMENQDWILYLNHPEYESPDYVDVFFVYPTGRIVHKSSGKLRQPAQKDLLIGRQQCVAFKVLPSDTLDVFIRSKQLGPSFPIIYAEITSRDSWGLRTYEFMYNQSLGNITFVSILLVMVLYHLMIYFATWDRSYLYYSLYVLSLSLVIIFESIATSYSLWNPIINQYLAIAFLLLISFFYYQFARSFLKTKTLTPKWDQRIKWVICAKLMMIICLLGYLYFTFDRRTVYNVIHILIGLDILILSAFFVSLYRSKSRLALYFIAGSTVIFVVGFSLLLLRSFMEVQTFVPFFISFIVHIMIFSLGLGYRMQRSERDKRYAQEEKLNTQKALNEKLAKINAAMVRFVPHEFIHSLGRKNVEEIQLGDSVEKENVTVLFCDIRSYTTLAEKMTLQENFCFLNDYLGKVGPIIKSHGGFVNQYFGDGVMAIFLDSADQAVCAAMMVHDAIQRFNAERTQMGNIPIQVGIGMHTGPLMMGIIGDQMRIEAGVVSDTVNTTARMEGLTKHFGNYTLVSECTLLEMSNPSLFQYRFLGRVAVKGRKEPVGVYDFYHGDPPDCQKLKQYTLKDFEKGLKHYFYREFHQASLYFEKVLDKHPHDLAAHKYHHYCLLYLQEGIREDWTGVEMVEKI